MLKEFIYALKIGASATSSGMSSAARIHLCDCLFPKSFKRNWEKWVPTLIEINQVLPVFLFLGFPFSPLFTFVESISRISVVVFTN